MQAFEMGKNTRWSKTKHGKQCRESRMECKHFEEIFENKEEEIGKDFRRRLLTNYFAKASINITPLRN